MSSVIINSRSSLVLENQRLRKLRSPLSKLNYWKLVGRRVLRTTGDYRALRETPPRSLKTSESIYWHEFHPRESREQIFQRPSSQKLSSGIGNISKIYFISVWRSEETVLLHGWLLLFSRAARCHSFLWCCCCVHSADKKFCQVLHFIITDDSSWLDTWQITTAACQLFRHRVLSTASAFSPHASANETHYLRRIFLGKIVYILTSRRGQRASVDFREHETFFFVALDASWKREENARKRLY